MTRGTGTAPPPSPQRGTATDNNSAGPQKKHYDGADGARPKNGMQLSREYGILASEKPVGDPATAGPWVRGAGHGATRGTADQGRMKTEVGDKTG